MKIEVGKSYHTVEGEKAEIDAHHPSVEDGFQFSGAVGAYRWWWNAEGESQFGDVNTIVAEWTDSPVRTVTRLEVVPGVYGRVYVDERGGVAFTNGMTVWKSGDQLTADELEAAAAVLTELAKAVRDV
jgi:hypothetical protein